MQKTLKRSHCWPDVFIKTEECAWNQLLVPKLIHPSALTWTDMRLTLTYALCKLMLIYWRHHFKKELEVMTKQT